MLQSDDDWHEDAGDESVVDVPGRLLAALRSEVEVQRASVLAASLRRSADVARERVACPLCPFRTFASGTSVKRHLEAAHTQTRGFVSSGRKQRKVVVALYDSDVLAGREPLDLLSRSADILRSSIVPPLPETKTAIDRQIRLVLTAAGPVYMRAAALGTTIHVRRVGNLYYTCCFANVLLRELVMAKGRLAEALTRVQLHACSAGSKLCNLMPQHGKAMWQLAQDVLGLYPVRELMSGFYAQLLAHEEFETLSMDATVKVCLGIMGQAGAAAIRADAAAAAMSEAAHLRRLVTVRGRSGSVLALRLVREESAEEIAAQLDTVFTLEQRMQVKFIGVDNPSGAMHRTFQKIFPNLRCLFLDVMHLAMNCEKGFGGQRSPGSMALRRVLKKFDAVNPALPPPTWSGAPFTGGVAAAHTKTEAALLKCFQGRASVARAEAGAFLTALDCRTPFARREEFIRALACVAVVYRVEMGRRGPKGATVASTLRNAAQPTKCAWYFNNHIHRHSIDIARVPLVASGTTGNEARLRCALPRRCSRLLFTSSRVQTG